MWITGDVDLPVELLEAHTSRSLAFFVGAGASMDAPSDLPSFRQLARDLAMAARVSFDEEAAIDYFLGSMPADFDTHRHARDLIARPQSTANATHSAIVRLAAAFGAPRIVTTNFDDHLRAAAVSESLPIADRWVGPALPLGENFTGLVHLHGSVERDPSELVLTDRDFGRAYLTDAWAARFLRRMFDTFTVLFVGYSHDDPIMRYLALGLPSRTSRFALTSEPEDDKWRHLGIRPIGYPAPASDHSAIPAVLNAWNRRARMDRHEHRAKIREIVEAGPIMMPVEEDYLRDCLSDVAGAREFTRFAAGVDWLLWLESVPGFQALFAGQAGSEVGGVLAQWFAATFVADPALHGAALQTVQRLGQRFSDQLYQSLAWAADALSESDGSAARRWKVLLATSVEGISAPPELGVVLPYEPHDVGEHLALLRVALRPSLALKHPWFRSDDPLAPPDAEVHWRIDEHSLTSHLLKLVDEAVPGDPSVGLALEESLNSAYGLLAAYHGDDHFDGLTSHRSAIEPHSQDDLREPVDAVIDGLRGYGEKSLAVRPDILERWWGFGYPLFQRLALHLIDIDSYRSADDKVRWVLDRDLLFEFGAKHEVYRVLSRSVPLAGLKVKSQLLERALLGTQFPNELPEVERHAAYIKYNLLVWLAKSDPTWAEATAALAVMQEANPNFGPREHPDFDVWSSSGTWGGVLPTQPEDFIQSVEEDVDRAIDELLSQDYSERSFDRPTWEDALSVLRRVSESRVDLGVRLWDAVERRGDLGARARDLRRAVIGGWERADLGEHALDVTQRVATQASRDDLARAVTRFLVEQIEKQLDASESASIDTMRQTARTVWTVHKDQFSHSGSADPSFLALNSWPGDLARFWTTEINRRWRALAKDWSGVNQTERDAIAGLLGGPEPTLDAVRPALASQTFFLFAADNDFAVQHIFPLFRLLDGSAKAWGAYLYHPRYNDQMLRAGFMQCVLAGWGVLDGLERQLKHQFYGLVSSIVMSGGITAEDRQALLDLTVLSGKGAHSAEFAASVLRSLTTGEPANGSEVWELWLRDHVSARLRGLPRTARAEELARWADIAPFLGAHASEAFEMFSGRRIALSSDYRTPELPEALLKSDSAGLVAYLAERIRNTTPAGWHTPYALRKLLPKLSEALGEDACSPMWDAAITAGFVLERASVPPASTATDSQPQTTQPTRGSTSA